jgi:pimeloyl-ACP methyl ester carboxylesterase/O-acetyl-ADP-ribose deacetylase (regulator of RNase III)
MKKQPRSRSKPVTNAGIAPTDPSLAFNMPEGAVEKALLSGTHVAQLEGYFGEQNYAELQALMRQAASRSVRGGPRVLIVPGTMGTKLGIPGAGLFGFDDVVWIDPCDVALGNLVNLSLKQGNTRITALDPLLIYYLKLKLRLRSAGFDAEFWGYDWRQDLSATAEQLVRRIERESAPEVFIVAHSMGGLISRLALAQGAKKVKRVVMLGTPNHGAYLAAQAIRGTLGSIRKLASIDPKHTAEQLCELAFNTFPSTYTLLPAAQRFTAFDLFDDSHWPKDGARFDAKLLAAAKRTHALLSSGDDRLCLVAGINQRTVTNLDRVGDQFVYEESLSGDGTVPLELARMDEIQTYFIEEEHGSLPNNAQVARGVIDILNTGSTRQLLADWRTARCEPMVRSVTDEELRVAVPDAKRGGELSSREFRNLLAPFLSADAKPDAPAAAPSIAISAPFASVRPLELNQVVVGRKRQKQLEVCVAEGDIAEVNARAIVLGLFREVAPGGAALALDERLNGAICEFVNRRMFSGNVGELFILPTGRHPVQADLVLFAGLGPFDRFNFEVLQLVAENTIRTLIRTNVEDFATVLLGSGTGVEMVDSLRHLLEGFVKAIKETESEGAVRRVTFCVRDPAKCREVATELFRLAGTELFQDIEVSFETKILPATVVRDRAAKPSSARPGPEPAYLIVRQENSGKESLAIRTSLLTAGAKATVITGQRTLRTATLHEELAVLGTSSFGSAQLDELGESLASKLLADEVLAVLPTVADRPLVVVHDGPAARIPWELLRIKGQFPVLNAGLSRRYLADNLSVAKWLESRRQSPKIQMLLVVNPNRGESGSLEGAEVEGQRMQELFAKEPGIEITVRAGAEATRAALLQDFRSGKYDLVHYAGHAYFDSEQPARSGIICHRQEILTGSDLATLGNLPNLVVFNACESARVRGGKKKPQSKPSILKQAAETTGMAEAFLRGGISNYVGTYWPVGDTPAVTFATTFYPALLRGKTMGEALLAARRAVREAGASVDWADYVHYGNQNFLLKTRA